MPRDYKDTGQTSGCVWVAGWGNSSRHCGHRRNIVGRTVGTARGGGGREEGELSPFTRDCGHALVGGRQAASMCATYNSHEPVPRPAVADHCGRISCCCFCCCCCCFCCFCCCCCVLLLLFVCVCVCVCVRACVCAWLRVFLMLCVCVKMCFSATAAL